MTNQHHVCFSNAPTCSGCNPCEVCAFHIRRCVLPVAMIAAGFNESPEQAEAFFRGYAAGWQRLHDAMMGDAALQQQFAAVLVAPRVPAQMQIPFAEPQPPQPPVGAGTLTYPFPQTYPMSPVDAQAVTLNGARREVGLPLEPVPAAAPSSHGLTEEDLQKPMDLQVVKSLLEEAEKKHEGAVEPHESREMRNTRVRSMTKPMDPEEIAAAAAPVVIGDVMNPPTSGE